MQWVWENKEAFGNNAPTEIISGFKFNLRFPGQYFDNETNLNYNIHRDYNPVWGRYTTSDPLGLAAGINTYGYVGGNSLGLSDKEGLQTDLNFFGIQETQYWRAMKYKPEKDWFSIAGHGNAIGGIYDKGLYSSFFFPKNTEMVSVPVEKLAQYIKSHPRYNPGMGVELLGCVIGVELSDDSRQYAQKLANILNANVRAPNKFIWYYADGKISINSSYMVNGEVRLNEKDPGKFNVFYPKK